MKIIIYICKKYNLYVYLQEEEKIIKFYIKNEKYKTIPVRVNEKQYNDEQILNSIDEIKKYLCEEEVIDENSLIYLFLKKSYLNKFSNYKNIKAINFENYAKKLDDFNKEDSMILYENITLEE